MIAARISIAALGLGAFAWGAAMLPLFWRQSAIELVAGKIVAGAPYKPHILQEQMAGVEAAERAERCRPIALRSAAIIRLRVLEETIAAGERALIDPRMDQLRASARRALACSPADPFLWLVLYWTENARTGFSAEHVRYLRLSYRLGAHEGWVAVRRSWLVLAVFDELPADLAERAIGEFAGLVESGFYGGAVAILAGPGWPLRERLLAGLSQVTLAKRHALAFQLGERGIDVAVPGVQPADGRPPWR